MADPTRSETAPEPLTTVEHRWLDHFRLACMGEYNALPWHMSPRIRAQMEAALLHDQWARELDSQRSRLTGELAKLTVP